MRIRHDYLARRPACVPQLAAWHYAEWRQLYAGWTPAIVAEELLAHRACAAIPTTLVALAGDEPVGSVSLLAEDGLAGFEDCSPWLASVYVDVPFRGRGIGARLVRRVMALARALHVPRLHLFTPGQEAFYAALGWRSFAPATAEGRAVTVMIWEPRGRVSRA
ncbi:MAG: GNAT family N-acetyltransferase [Gammaproteobacteria bacterium]|nr:GNAT family N-acetyltransferase [Gammaproteobacteria bacterium]